MYTRLYIVVLASTTRSCSNIVTILQQEVVQTLSSMTGVICWRTLGNGVSMLLYRLVSLKCNNKQYQKFHTKRLSPNACSEKTRQSDQCTVNAYHSMGSGDNTCKWARTAATCYKMCQHVDHSQQQSVDVRTNNRNSKSSTV